MLIQLQNHTINLSEIRHISPPYTELRSDHYGNCRIFFIVHYKNIEKGIEISCSEGEIFKGKGSSIKRSIEYDTILLNSATELRNVLVDKWRSFAMNHDKMNFSDTIKNVNFVINLEIDEKINEIKSDPKTISDLK